MTEACPEKWATHQSIGGVWEGGGRFPGSSLVDRSLSNSSVEKGDRQSTWDEHRWKVVSLRRIGRKNVTAARLARCRSTGAAPTAAVAKQSNASLRALLHSSEQPDLHALERCPALPECQALPCSALHARPQSRERVYSVGEVARLTRRMLLLSSGDASLYWKPSSSVPCGLQHM